MSTNYSGNGMTSNIPNGSERLIGRRLSENNKRLQPLLVHLTNNISESVSLESLSLEFHIEKNYLNALFKRETGVTVHRHILTLRSIFARRMIQAGCSPIDTAYNVGFNDYSNFFRAYKTILGVSPSGK
jgi:transcriptional regulator GlxA family with amidase domain